MPAAANNICPSSLISVLVSATAITSFGIPCSKREEATASSCVRYSVYIVNLAYSEDDTQAKQQNGKKGQEKEKSSDLFIPAYPHTDTSFHWYPNPRTVIKCSG